MFRKENSSCSTTKSNNSNNAQGGKPSNNNHHKKGGKQKAAASAAASAKTTTTALDVPLRKSDIRHLRQRTKDFFSVARSAADGGSTRASPEHPEEASTVETLAQQRDDDDDDAVVATILDQVFLPGNISSRQLHHPELGKLTLYIRTPHNTSSSSSPTDAPPTAVDDNNSSHHHPAKCDFVWPYAAPQVIWISQPPMPNTRQVEVAMPTLALLSVLPPETMPTVYIPSPASKFLVRGAHLMRAGMLNLPAFAAATAAATTTKSPHYAALVAPDIPPRVVAVAVHGNPQPMAVGVIDAGVQSVRDIGAGTKGVGATVWTCYGDDLWHQQFLELDKLMVQPPPVHVSPIGGANFNDGHYGNVGFLEAQRVVPIIVSSSEGEEEDDDQAQTAWDANGTEDAKDAGDTGEANTVDADEKASDDSPTGDAGNPQQEAPPNAEEKEPVSQEDLLHQAVCKAFLASLSPKDLPMTVANFYANHVLPNRPPGTTIQLKQTKYKKFGNYLQEQVEQKLLVLGPGPNKGNKDKTGYLVSFDKRHPILLAYKQDHSEEVQQAKDTKNATAASDNHKLVLVNLHVVPHHFISPLRLDPEAVKGTNASSPERAGTGMLTLPEVRKLLEDYLEREKLADFDQVQLDGPLFDVLYKKKKGGDVTNNTLTVSRKDIADQWVAAMDAAYAIVQMPGSKVLKLGRGKPPKVQIEVSMRQSKKFITKLRGMESYGVNGQVLAKDIGRRLATQAAVETESEKGAALAKGCVEIVLGGSFADELEALLLGDEKLCPGHGGIKNSDYKLPKNSIEVVLPKGVPARKRTKKAGGKK